MCRGKFKNSRFTTICLHLRFIGLDALSQDPCQVMYPVAVADEEETAYSTLPWTLTSPSTNSEETFTKIQAWLRRCGETHITCGLRRDTESKGWHPTRLVEIASEPKTVDSADDLLCRIVDPRPGVLPWNQRYITLSHRWPEDPRALQMLTVETLPQWQVALPIKLLHPTFRDAFLVAYKLGISFVWIDSLCIIQAGDDFADWKREAPMMQKVYSNAEFNICASKSAPNENGGGLFAQRDPLHFPPRQFQWPKDSDVDNLKDSGHYLLRKEAAMDTWHASMHNSPLASRGWVFQEQLLSHSNIHFGDLEVSFECLDMRASESLGSSQDYQVPWQDDHPPFKRHLPVREDVESRPVASEDRRRVDYEFEDGYHRWHELLTQYTALQLTRSDDRLVALSGVAQYFQRFFAHDDCYIAGLWHSCLVTELLWQMKEPTPKGAHSRPFREARHAQQRTRRHWTFSWLSVQGQIEYKVERPWDREHLADVQVVRYRMAPETMDATTGEGQPCTEDIFSLPSEPTVEVKLTGFLRPMRLRRVGFHERWNMWPAIRGQKNADLDLVLFLSRHLYSSSHTGETMLDFEISPTELDHLNRSGRLFLMPLHQPSPATLWFLLLERVETGGGMDMGRFRRIGVYKTFPDELLKEWLFLEEPFRKLATARSPSTYTDLRELPCWRYNEETKKHTIFIV